uniref:Uncharacterized protein n=1 Tax=Candidatus Kentrum sp. TC TaxID=2126339 RepID=A0A450ZMM3_9GAMM|nr:MAG: hypothetical protein BECKTC1821F_GA0114240_100655 [Candidatus Kentron sp. TC]
MGEIPSPEIHWVFPGLPVGDGPERVEIYMIGSPGAHRGGERIAEAAKTPNKTPEESPWRYGLLAERFGLRLAG